MVAFTYAGPVAGAYRAEGGLRGGSSMLDRTGTIGGREGSGPAIMAGVQRGGGRADWMTVPLPQLTRGSLPISSDCTAVYECAQVGVGFGMTNFHGQAAEHGCALVSGTMRPAEITDDRARGDFSGSGWCITADGEMEEGFRITGGTFDVRLR